MTKMSINSLNYGGTVYNVTHKQFTSFNIEFERYKKFYEIEVECPNATCMQMVDTMFYGADLIELEDKDDYTKIIFHVYSSDFMSNILSQFSPKIWNIENEFYGDGSSPLYNNL